MKCLKYKLFSNGYINRFLTVGVFSKESPFEKAVLQGKINEWLVKGPSIYDNPSRLEVVEKRSGNIPPYRDLDGFLPGDEIEVFGQKNKMTVYFPFGNTGIDESRFYTNPAYLRSYGCTYMEVPRDECAKFQISTCGALTVWLNDELVADFVPFERNVEQHTIVEMKLKKGTNKLIVCLEDLAERDTDFYYRVRYLGQQEIEIQIPVQEETDIELIQKAEKALSNMFFEKEAYLSEPVYLNLEAFCEEPVEMVLSADRNIGPKNYVIQPGQKKLMLFHADEIPSSFYFFQLNLTVSGLAMSKVIGTYSFNTRFMGYHEDTYEVRKQRIWSIIRNENEKNEYRTIIRLHEGEMPNDFQRLMNGYLAWINEKRDCSDFRMIVVVFLYVKFAHRFTEEMRQRIEDAMLGYRYWIDEPGDDVMWFFSENHALMFHISQYFAGKSLPDRIFTCSGLTGEEECKKAEGLLETWLEVFFKESTTEWNSSTYLPIDVMGLAYLYDLTEKGSYLHEKAKKALDMLAFTLAVNEHKGNIMTSFGRTYERELKGSYSTGMPSLLYLFYNAGHMNDHFRALVPIIVGDYEPPKEYEQYVKLQGEEELIHQNTQGIDQFVNLYLYKNSKALLSTAVAFRPYGPGYQENVVQATLDGTAQVFINHPGELQIYGHGRPGFWAGNGCLPLAVQYRNVSILKYHIEGENCLDYTHAYVPLSEFHSYKISENAIALEKDGGFIGVRALNGLWMQKEGPCYRREFISTGRDNVWVVKVGTYEEYHNVEEVLRDMEEMEITNDCEKVMVIDSGNKYIIEKQQLMVNGEKVHHYPLDATGKLEISGKKAK